MKVSPCSGGRDKISARAEIRHVIGSLAGLSFHLGLLDRERLSARAELRNAGFLSEHEFKTHSTTQWTRMVCKRYKKKSCYNNCGRIGYHKLPKSTRKTVNNGNKSAKTRPVVFS